MAFKYLIFALIVATCYGQDPTVSTTEATLPSTEAPLPPPEPMPKMECVAPGYMCSDCNNLAVCIGDGSGGFKQIENKCAPGSHCVNNACVAGAKCNYRKFECSDDGFFPDSYVCTTYHVCVHDAVSNTFHSMEMNCGEGRGSYDASTASCGYPMNSTACLEGPVPKCTEPLQVGMLKSDPSIYYLCTADEHTMGPQMFKCKGGNVFDVKKVSCVPAKKAKSKSK